MNLPDKKYAINDEKNGRYKQPSSFLWFYFRMDNFT